MRVLLAVTYYPSIPIMNSGTREIPTRWGCEPLTPTVGQAWAGVFSSPGPILGRVLNGIPGPLGSASAQTLHPKA